jgi:branched-chain amino acid transport system substrate-binding protein
VTRTLATLGASVAAMAVLLSSCANDPSAGGGDGSAASDDFNELPIVDSVDVAADAVLPAGDGKAQCDDGTTIAYVGAITGPNAQLGINIYTGAELAIEQHNENNPECQVEFVKLDTEGDPNKATGPVSEVVNNEDVVAVLGLPFSGESKATGQIFEEAGLPHITPSATNPALTSNGWTTFFRGLGNDNVQGPAAGRLAEKLGAESVYVVQDDSDYGIGLGEAAASGLGDRLAGTDKVTTGQKDFSATVSKIMSSEADAVFYAGYFPEGAPLNQQLVAKGYQGIFIGPDGVKDQNFIDLAGDASSNAYFTCPCVPGDLIPDFADAYEQKFNEVPGTYGVEGYDATTILLAAIDAGNNTRESILKFIQDYDAAGLGKHYKWDETGELAELPVFGFKVQDGTIVSLGEID